MSWTARINRLAGASLLLFMVLFVLSTVLSFSYSEANPFDRGEIDDLLIDTKDNEAIAILSTAFGIGSAVFLLAVAVGLYAVFRSRDRVLALVGFAGLLAASVAFMASVAGQETVIILADDFEVGGAGELAAGDDAILEVARAVAISSGVILQIGVTAEGLALIAFGALIAGAAAGAASTPPRWLGWLAVVVGSADILVWLGVLAEPFFALFGIAALGLLIWLLVLGVWLIRQPEEEGGLQPVGAAV